MRVVEDGDEDFTCSGHQGFAFRWMVRVSGNGIGFFSV
jgi:hypothetical protein